jgi:hypothetical protein
VIPGLTPEQEARVRAVDEDSPAMERAGAWLMGAYVPKTEGETAILEAVAWLVLREHGLL